MSETVDDFSAVEERLRASRLLEALLFASAEPLSEAVLIARLGSLVPELLEELRERHAGRGVVLEHAGSGWAFRTAADLAGELRFEEAETNRKPSRAVMETLAIVAYHQPVTRAEIERVRGVATGRGTLDILMERGWIRPGKRRETPGRPLTWVTTEAFLDHFSLECLRDLPAVEELRAAGLLDARPVVYGARPNDDGEEG